MKSDFSIVSIIISLLRRTSRTMRESFLDDGGWQRGEAWRAWKELLQIIFLGAEKIQIDIPNCIIFEAVAFATFCLAFSTEYFSSRVARLAHEAVLKFTKSEDIFLCWFVANFEKHFFFFRYANERENKYKKLFFTLPCLKVFFFGRSFNHIKRSWNARKKLIKVEMLS